MRRRKRPDPDRVMVWWTVAGAVALLAFFAFGEFLVYHPDLVRREQAGLPPLIDHVPSE